MIRKYWKLATIAFVTILICLGTLVSYKSVNQPNYPVAELLDPRLPLRLRYVLHGGTGSDDPNTPEDVIQIDPEQPRFRALLDTLAYGGFSQTGHGDLSLINHYVDDPTDDIWLIDQKQERGSLVLAVYPAGFLAVQREDHSLVKLRGINLRMILPMLICDE